MADITGRVVVRIGIVITRGGHDEVGDHEGSADAHRVPEAAPKRILDRLANLHGVGRATGLT